MFSYPHLILAHNLEVYTHGSKQSCFSPMLILIEGVCYSLAAARNKSATRPALPPGAWRRMERKTGKKTVGRDKGSLTEKQTKGTGTTTTQKRGIHNTKQQNAESNSHRPPPPRAPEP